ncbi:MAG: GTPase [Candidatus Amoebophilus sp.]
MKHTYSLKVIAHILIVGLFLQGCSGLANASLNNMEGHNKQPDIQSIMDKEFVAEGGHLVTFYNEKDEIKASLQVNPLDEKDKFYNGVDVIIEKGAELASLAKLDTKTQQKRIQIQFSKEQKGKPESVVVHKSWLMGGGNEGGNGDGSPRAVIMFCGNPGVGKSTLCNSVFGRPVFESGMSLGRGLTKAKQQHMYQGNLYVDTPGLDDATSRTEAAREIEAGLKQNNDYKIVFVAVLEEGRIRGSDLATIDTICKAIKTPFEYGLIFNKVSKEELEMIEEAKLSKEELYQFLAPLYLKPSKTIILTHEKHVKKKRNTPFEDGPNKEKLLKFIDDLNPKRIKTSDVKPLNTRSFEEMQAKFEDAIKSLTKQLESQRDRINELEDERNKTC